MAEAAVEEGLTLPAAQREVSQRKCLAQAVVLRAQEFNGGRRIAGNARPDWATW